MNHPLQLHDNNGTLSVLQGNGALLFTYVYAPQTATNESTRPYIHPIHNTRGDVLTNFRPNDHPWHHGLSMTLCSVNGINFWGGPTHRTADGYQWRDNHGVQVHRDWKRRDPGHIEHTLDWREAKGDRSLITETRSIHATFENEAPDTWSLRWTSVLKNTSGETLTLGNYHSLNNLVGSHYTGLQFRGARALLDDHGDSSIGITAEGELRGEAQVHGVTARWMEWHTQHDTSLRRTHIRFENLGDALPWFVRRNNPLAVFSFHSSKNVMIETGAELKLDHQLTFTTHS